MKYTPPTSVELTKVEQALFEKVKVDLIDEDRFEWLDVAEWQEDLTTRLLYRKAVPDVRWQLIETALLSIKRNNPGGSVFTNPHFTKYLVYLVCGPELPSRLVDGFCRQLNQPFGDDQERICRWVREAVRSQRLVDKEDEFYRLAIEVGLSPSVAKLIRQDVMRTQS